MTIEKQVTYLVTMDAGELNRLLTDISCLCDTDCNDEFKRVCMGHALGIIRQLQDAGYYEKTPS